MDNICYNLQIHPLAVRLQPLGPFGVPGFTWFYPTTYYGMNPRMLGDNTSSPTPPEWLTTYTRNDNQPTSKVHSTNQPKWTIWYLYFRVILVKVIKTPYPTSTVNNTLQQTVSFPQIYCLAFWPFFCPYPCGFGRSQAKQKRRASKRDLHS